MHYIRKSNLRRSNKGKALAKARWAKPYRGKAPTAEEMRLRALHDARGMIVAEGKTYRSDRVIAYTVRRSVNGRTDQFDILLDGRLWKTGGKRKVREWTGLRI